MLATDTCSVDLFGCVESQSANAQKPALPSAYSSVYAELDDVRTSRSHRVFPSSLLMNTVERVTTGSLALLTVLRPEGLTCVAEAGQQG